jgi:hypothetical protein
MLPYGALRNFNATDGSPALPSRCQKGESKTRSARTTGRRLRRIDARRARAAARKEIEETT